MMTRFAVVFFLFLTSVGFAQITLKGTVTDQTGELLAFATVKSVTESKGVTTSFDGKYSLDLKAGEHILVVEAFGYTKQEVTIQLKADLVKNFKLQESVNVLEEVVITGKAPDENVSKVEMSVETLVMDDVKKLPAFMGEVDVIKTIQLLPGVTTVGEGATGFNVRGGNTDQNLVLMDDAPIYSSSHLFGFFSIFNSDAVKDVKLYKGGIPAQYGGRLSSVLDIHQAEGNSEKLSGKGGIGVVSSRLTVGGPMKKDQNRGTWLVAGRRSYADVFLRMSSDPELNQNVAYFYDLNGKASYKLNDNNKLFFSSYYGRDVFRFGKDFGFKWGNGTATLRLNHTFSDSLFVNVSLVHTNYSYGVGVPEGENAFDWTSKIMNYNLNVDYNWIASAKSKLSYGGQLNTYFYKPGEAVPGPENVNFEAIKVARERGVEPNLYVSHEYMLSDKLTAQYGLRYSSYFSLGGNTIYNYQDDIPKSNATIVDSTVYGSGEVIKQYHGLEPRLGVKYSLDSTSSVKFSYNRTRQNVHLISNTTSSVPFDVWKSSGAFVKPAIADQIATGYFRNFKDNMYETSVEVYYKWMQNLVEYKNGAELLLNPTLETELLTAQGRAYGSEFMVRKKKGKFTGWLSYTWAKTERKVDSEFIEEQINGGEWYPSNYDKRHDMSLVGAYDISKRLNVGLNFSYAQGRPVTLSDGQFIYDNYTYFNYSDRNQSRIPNYHRLDLSATLQGKKNDIRRWNSSWVLSIYNVYGRKNPYSVYTKTDENGLAQDYQLSILGSVLPAVTYNFEF